MPGCLKRNMEHGDPLANAQAAPATAIDVAGAEGQLVYSASNIQIQLFECLLGHVRLSAGPVMSKVDFRLGQGAFRRSTSILLESIQCTAILIPIS